MSNRHYHDDFSEIEEETLAMLGSRFTRVAASGNQYSHGRRRQDEFESDHREMIRKPKRERVRVN